MRNQKKVGKENQGLWLGEEGKKKKKQEEKEREEKLG